MHASISLTPSWNSNSVLPKFNIVVSQYLALPNIWGPRRGQLQLPNVTRTYFPCERKFKILEPSMRLVTRKTCQAENENPNCVAFGYWYWNLLCVTAPSTCILTINQSVTKQFFKSFLIKWQLIVMIESAMKKLATPLTWIIAIPWFSHSNLVLSYRPSAIPNVGCLAALLSLALCIFNSFGQWQQPYTAIAVLVGIEYGHPECTLYHNHHHAVGSSSKLDLSALDA